MRIDEGTKRKVVVGEESLEVTEGVWKQEKRGKAERVEKAREAGRRERDTGRKGTILAVLLELLRGRNPFRDGRNVEAVFEW